MRRVTLLTLIGAAMVTALLMAQAPPKYRDPSVPVDERVADLLSRMTLQEKVAQLTSYRSRDADAFDENGNFTPTRDADVLQNGIGAFSSRDLLANPSIRWHAQAVNSLQRYLIEKTRLGIPALIFAEALHGFMAAKATSFPQAVGLGSTWDTDLVEQVFTAAALEAHMRGIRQVLAPVADLSRDPRWGRTEECYGEDPYLTSRMTMAAVFGLQGHTLPMDEEHVAVTLKHFAGHGQSEGGRNQAPVNYSERYFRNTHLYPFEMAITRAHAQSVMASYNEWDGVPNHVNHKLLTDILRGEWGFKGYVMSDGGGMDVTYNTHFAASGPAESGALSIAAGVDYDLGSRGCFSHLVDQVHQRQVTEASIDRAVSSVLRVKFNAGLFDHPYVDADRVEQVTNSPEHKALALEAGHEAMVLLKNENGMIPFDASKIKRLAVVGPNAPDVHLGGYSPTPMEGVSVLEGLQEYARGKFEVTYAPGCRLTLNKQCHWLVNEKPILGDPMEDYKLIGEATDLVRQSDAVVLVLGENELLDREAWSDDHLGDTDSLQLVGRQQELADAILATGKPTVILLINGRPLAINQLQEKAPAIIECWYLGQETGHAVADAIFGEVNPSGKLTITFPRSVGQLPDFYDKKPSNHRAYELADSTPLYPFGFGLSYTTFSYSDLSVTPAEITPDGKADVAVRVTNTGQRAGDEVAQLYIRDLIALPTRPVKELKDFARVTLQPGESKVLHFALDREKLESVGMDMKRVVQPGDFEIMVGGNSADLLKTRLTVRGM